MQLILCSSTQAFKDQEAEVLQQVFNTPVYFVEATPEVTAAYAHIKTTSSSTGSIIEAFFNSRTHVESTAAEPSRVLVTLANVQVCKAGCFLFF